MLNLKHLYYYHVFAQELSTARAAKRLGITSPALSNQLKQLEEYLGVPLTHRAKGKVVITESGEMVRHYAERMFSVYTELKTNLSFARDLRTANFRVGICQYLGAEFSFDLLSLVEKSNLTEAQNVHLTFDSSDNLIAPFIKDQFDLVIGAFSAELTEKSSWICQKLAFPVRLFVPPCLAEGMGFADKQTAVDLNQVFELAIAKRISLVLPMLPSALRNETDRFLLASRLPPIKTIESNRSGAIVQLIERGFAMGFVPTPCLLDFKSARTLSVLGPAKGYWSHDISVLVQKSAESSTSKISPLADIFSPAPPFT